MINSVKNIKVAGWSIGRKLTVAFLFISILPMSLVVYFNLLEGEKELTEIARADLITEAQNTSYHLDQILQGNQRNSAALAGNPLVVNFLAATDEERQQLRPQIDELLKNFTSTYPDYYSPGLLDRRGIVQATLNKILLGKDRSFRGYFQASIKGAPFISNMLVGRATGKLGVFLTHPIQSKQGEILGIDLIWLKADTIWDIIDQAKIGNAGISYLIDQDGVIIAHPNRDHLYHSLSDLPSEVIASIVSTKRFGSSETGEPHIPKSLGMGELAKQVLGNGETETLRYFSPLDQQYHIASYARLKTTNWTVVVDLPESQFLQPIDRLRVIAALSIGLVALLSLAISVLLAKGITRPIRQLTMAAAEIKSGQPFDPQSLAGITHGRDEVAYLGRVFNAVVQSLTESEEKFRALADTSPLAIYMSSDLEQTAEYINPTFTKLFGYTIDEVPTAGHWWPLAYPDVNYRKQVEDEWQRRVEHAIATNSEIEPMEVVVTCKDGAEKNISWGFSAVGKQNWALGIDLTERKKGEQEKRELEAQLQQAYKMEAVGTMAGGIAHDFNNLLAIIRGNTDIILRKQKNGRPIDKNLEFIHQATNRAIDLVKQILAFSRQEKTTLEPVDLTVVVGGTLNLLRSTIPSTVEIVSNVAQGSVLVNADATQIQQIIINLGANAVHAMKGKGKLTVNLEEVELSAAEIPKKNDHQAGRYAQFTVTDTGSGMDEETMARIFEPFYTTKGVGEGTGMGLAMSYGIVNSHGGFISVDSTPGHGSRFDVYLPIIDERRQQSEKTTIQALPIGTERILLVDDEEDVSSMVTELLEYQGYQITSTTWSAEALAIFKGNPEGFDLIITDQTMPEMTGAELATELLKIRPDIPIILCSGFSSSISENDAMSIGIRKFCMKPLSESQLALVVRKVLDGGYLESP